MLQHTSKKCFTIESLVGKETNSSAVDEPVRPTALRFTESVHPPPFGSCFQSTGRTLYSSPDLMFPEPCSHSANPALSLHPLQLSSQPFFNPHQREALNYYPWVLRNRYLGHRFQGKYSSVLYWFLFYLCKKQFCVLSVMLYNPRGYILQVPMHNLNRKKETCLFNTLYKQRLCNV